MTTLSTKPESYQAFALSKRPVPDLPLARSAPLALADSPLTPALMRPFQRPAIGDTPLPRLPERRAYAVGQASGWISRLGGEDMKTGQPLEIELPFGTPRFINAKTLKRMLKANKSDVLLKATGEAWSVCEDATPIDLTDTSVQFRLGAVAIYS